LRFLESLKQFAGQFVIGDDDKIYITDDKPTSARPFEPLIKQ
jgi:hypothetical protein